MTLTETRPEEVDQATDAAPPLAPKEGWLTTADHKRVGLIYLFFSLLFLLVGGAIGVALKAELADSGVSIVDGNFARLFSEHATVSVLLFLAPAWVGLASFLVPLQIGASRLAFPRAMAFSLWLYVFGGGTLLVSYMIGPPQGAGAGGLGLTSALPVGAPGHGDTPTELWIMALVLLATASIVAAASLAVTLLKLRAPGLTMRRLPMFSTATFVTSMGILLATPVFLAGLFLLYLDTHYGGTLFSPKTPGATQVWQHTVWLFGRPEVFLLSLPALGAAADIVATHARRPFLDDRPLQGAIALFGILSFGTWWLVDDAANALVLPNPPALSAVLGLPVAIVVLVLLGTLAKGKTRPHVSLLFVAGFVVLLAFGAANGIIAAVAGVHGHAWTEGHLHVVIFGAPTVLLAGAIYHWAPKLFGRQLSAGVGGAVFLLLFGGFFLMGLGDYLLGYNGAPAHVKDFPSSEDWTTYSQLGTVGAALLALGGLVLLADMVRALATKGETAPDDPYEGLTLEWATTSPPPPHNFDAVPEVRSAYPVYDLRRGGAD
jgi:heme/copper-type cytochrome/quinol oxidase subunit 1